MLNNIPNETSLLQKFILKPKLIEKFKTNIRIILWTKKSKSYLQTIYETRT